MSKNSTSYVYDGKEVLLTGRYAKSKDKKTKQDNIVVEIYPVGGSPEDKSFCKWIPVESLMIIVEDDTLEL